MEVQPMVSKELRELRQGLEAVWTGEPTSKKYGLGYREAVQPEGSFKEPDNTFEKFSREELARIGGLAMPKKAAQPAELGSMTS